MGGIFLLTMEKPERLKVINRVKTERGVSTKLPIYQLKEPFEDEMDRIRFNELSDEAKDFAFQLEPLVPQKFNNGLLSNKSHSITEVKSKYYSWYKIAKDSPSLGLILTNIDLNRIKRNKNGKPVFWQMGKLRLSLAMAQRALYFDENQNKEIYKVIERYENSSVKIPPRGNLRSKTVEEALGKKTKNSQALYTPAISELGYKKISSNETLSRREIFKTGLFNMVGKYPRKILGLGAMPPVSGWRDTLIMSAVGHMVCFIPRSSMFANDIKKRIKLGVEAKKVVNSLKIKASWKYKVERNIGAALGAENPQEEVKIVKRLYKEAGIKLFRIYTIGSDARVIKTAQLLRQTFGDDIEIFVGQIADKTQAEKLISKDIKVDGLIYGHGGGQQCTSAINGMAITTLEDIYDVTLDKKFNKTTILVEGGLGRSIGTALILGVDAGLGNQKFVHGTIETGGLFVESLKGKVCQPYPGTASPVTQIIESQDRNLRVRRIDAAGRTHYSEGKPGLMFYEEKACSMAFWINEYLRHAARTFADLGVKNISQLRGLLKKDKKEYLRILSEQTQYLSEAHWNM